MLLKEYTTSINFDMVTYVHFSGIGRYTFLLRVSLFIFINIYNIFYLVINIMFTFHDQLLNFETSNLNEEIIVYYLNTLKIF